MSKAAEKTLSDVFKIGFGSQNYRLKPAPFLLVEQTLRKLAQNSVLDKVFDRSLVRWTESWTFMTHSPNVSQLTPEFSALWLGHSAKIMIEQSDVIDDKNNPQSSSLSFLQTPLLSPQSSDDKPYRTHVKTRKSGTRFRPDVDKDRRKHNHKWKSSSSASLMRPFKSSSPSNTELIILNLSKMAVDHRPHKTESKESHLPVLQSVNKHHAAAVDFLIYCFFNWSSRYEETVTSYIAKSARKIRLQMKAHFFIPKDPILIIGFLAALKLVCGTNHIYKKGAMWVLPHFAY